MYSFDVFDTLITRTTATPQGIFTLMADRIKADREKYGLEDYIVDDFWELRVQSEEFVRKISSIKRIEEITLQDIYRAMASSGCLGQEQIDRLCRLEQDMEIDHVIGIHANIKRLKGLLMRGEHVILISDMYLPEKTIRDMLLRVDDIFQDIPLYVSSTYGVRKTTGDLYRYVQREEQVDIKDWTHIGDDLYQDIEIPYQLGIRVEWSPKIGLTDHEKALLDVYGDDSRLQLMIGAALKAEQRELAEKEDVGQSAVHHIGCRYAGPVLYSYAEWVVEQAIRKGVKRLYFIARDGYLIKKIVDILLEKANTDITTHYIYGSRKAWRMPSLSKEHYNLYQLIFWSHMNRIDSLDALAEVLHISLQDLYRFLPGTYAKDKEDIRISNQELEYIARKLEENAGFKAFHLQVLSSERRSVQRYLDQEIDTSDDHFAFVDISGGGMTQGCLRELLRDRYQKPIHTFFFRMDRVGLIEGSITDIFLPGYEKNRLVIEMMCRAPHGQTKGYVRKDGQVVPELEETETRALIEHGFYDYERGITDFVYMMLKISEKSDKRMWTVRNVRFYLRDIAQKPSKDVLRFFASMPGSETGRRGELIEYAPRLTEHDIKEIFLRRTYEPIEMFYKGTDLDYSILRASEDERALIEKCIREHDLTMGKLYRLEDEQTRRKLCSRYGRAAFYPVRMLEERLILYGAGKFGQDLYHRLQEDMDHEVVLWVDEKASDYRQKGLTDVSDISAIKGTSDEQIIIAVMAKELADTIQRGLERSGVDKKRILWIHPYNYPSPDGKWDMERVG